MEAAVDTQGSGQCVVLDCGPQVTIANFQKLIYVLTTMTTAEAERVFSTFERTATAVHAHMAEERLAALVMLYSHRNRTPRAVRVVQQFVTNDLIDSICY